jgi:hypothetical protein
MFAQPFFLSPSGSVDPLSSNTTPEMMVNLIMALPPRPDAELEILHRASRFEPNGAILDPAPRKAIAV